ncbi:hypothetical protein JQN58_05965 [Aneurinibacillus sp. BA2021]|nr:hypothetical protein [Aneurinibacillus sp. BA2021]
MGMLRNEKGAALLLVFLILIIFTILGVSVMTITMQSSQIRTFMDSEIEGKMLAETGLSYFQEYMEEKLKGKRPSELIDKEVVSIIQEIASPIQLLEDKSKMEDKKIVLPKAEGQQGESGFAIFYNLGQEVKYSDGSSDLPQPYIRKVEVSIIGMPAGSGAPGVTQKKVRLNATVYINTIPAPFHSAVSTQGNLLLFGGTNIIGNVAANNIITTHQYYYIENTQFQTVEDADEKNVPYIEGKVTLSEQGKLYRGDSGFSISSYQRSSAEKPIVRPSSEGVTEVPDLSFAALRREKLFTPLPDMDKEERSAPGNAPYIPGLEPPIMERTKQNIPPLFSDASGNTLTVKEHIEQQLMDAKTKSTKITVDEMGQPITFDTGDENNGFRYYSETPSDKKLYIESEQLPGDPLPLTVRLTGDELNEKINKLYIAPQSDRNSVTVEMGRRDAFEASVSEPKEKPFTYKGIIVIRGNLDIYNDINMNGIIYVDGDVVIREATNKSSEDNNNKLAIIASGTITLANRYPGSEFDDTNKRWQEDRNHNAPSPLYAFIYTDNSFQEHSAPPYTGLEMYSIDSVNHIVGGIGTANGQIELNTKREGTSQASRLTIQFNRKIFEDPFPGLPSDQQFFIDLYDITYTAL